MFQDSLKRFGPLALLACFGSLQAQQPGPVSGSAVLIGRIVDGATGRAVPSAIVTLINASELSPAMPAATSASDRVQTDDDGEFIFSGLAAGSYRLTAAKIGYADGAYGRERAGGVPTSLDVNDRDVLDRLTIKLWRFGAIGGTVTDEAGEPVVNQTVRVLRRSVVAGVRRWSNAGAATTDDRGFYRVATLLPGDYTVFFPGTQVSYPADLSSRVGTNVGLMTALVGSVVPFDSSGRGFGGMAVASPGWPGNQLIDGFLLQSAQTFRSSAPAAPHDGPMLVYSSTFAPGLPSPTGAVVVSLRVGEERSDVDIRLNLVATVRVSGTITSASGSPVPDAVVRVTPASDTGVASEPGFNPAVGMSDRNGKFLLFGVPSGQYVLHVLKNMPNSVSAARGSQADPTMWASQPLSVTDRDVTGLSIEVRTGVRVSGRVDFQGSAPKPPAGQLRNLIVSLRAADAHSVGAQSFGIVDADGLFTTAATPAGKYLVNVAGAPMSWTLKVATAKSQNVSDVPFDLTSDITDVVVVMTDQPTEIRGTVRTASGAADTGAIVLAFPADRAAWIDYGYTSRRLQAARTNRSGTYLVSGLASGTYCVIAVADATAADWQDTAFLEAASRLAARLTIGDSEQKTQDLRTAVVR